MISIKMMKNAALRNLQRYATTEHIFGIGMATKKNEAALSPKKQISHLSEPMTVITKNANFCWTMKTMLCGKDSITTKR